MSTTTTITGEALVRDWRELREKEGVRIRDGAERLGVSEGALVAAHLRLEGGAVTVLKPEWTELFEAFKGIGRVMALTRNHAVVHERKGLFREVNFFGDHAMGQVVGPDLDMRMFPKSWGAVFVVHDDEASGLRESIQIFDLYGEAVLKVYPQPEADQAAWGAIEERFRSGEAVSFEGEVPAAEADLPDSEIDVEGLCAAWAALQDTHEFHGMIRKFKVGRTQAHRLVGPEFAESISPTCSEALLLEASSQGFPIMVFVGNRGNIQIHTGEVRNIKRMGDWVNVLDPEFNLHLNESGVASAWRVRKPTKDGVVTSIELFDANGENVALFFGKRKPGQAEDAKWRLLAESLK